MRTDSTKIFDYEHLSEILTEGIFSTMAKPVGRRCNLNCSYCYYLKKGKSIHSSGPEIMDETMLEEYIRQYINVPFVWKVLMMSLSPEYLFWKSSAFLK